MRKKRSKIISVCVAAVISLSLGACTAPAKNSPKETETAAAAESSTPKSEEQLPETLEESRESDVDEPEKANQADDSDILDGENAALSNPIQEAESSEDFKEIGLTLELPENEEWYSQVSYALIGGSVAQISFYDEIAESYALARACDGKEGDPSGIYYNFDDKKKESWSTTAEDGSKIYITIQVTENNADVHGALASWSFKGIRYSLWEDDARDRTDAVARTAIEIAKRIE